MSKKQVESWIKENKPLLPLLLDVVRRYAGEISKWALRLFWKDIEPYLTNARLVAEIIVKERPDLKDVLYSPEGKSWLIKNLREIYDYLYDYAWGEE